MIRLLAYDIEDNKRRHKIVMELEGEARRMQYSVFKVFLTEGCPRALIRKTKKLMSEEKGDSLFISTGCVLDSNSDANVSERSFLTGTGN